MRDEKKATVDRRDFLRKVGVGTVGAGATLTTPSAVCSKNTWRRG